MATKAELDLMMDEIRRARQTTATDAQAGVSPQAPPQPFSVERMMRQFNEQRQADDVKAGKVLERFLPTKTRQEMAATGVTERAGQIAGGFLGRRFGKPGVLTGKAIGGAVGAGLGLVGQRLLTEGELPSVGEVGAEMGFSGAGEVAIPLLGRLKRGFFKGTPQAQIVRRTEATAEMRDATQDIFLAPERADVARLFDEVRDSGEIIDLTDVKAFLDDFVSTGAPGKIGELERVVRALDRKNKTGGRWAQLFEQLKPGGQAQAVDNIGDLQQLHSQIRKLTEAGQEFESRQLLRDFNEEIDSAIFSGLEANPASPNAQKLLEARRGWARLRAAEEFDDFLEDNIDTTSDAVFDMFSLNRFKTALRRNRSRAAQAVNRSLNATLGARARLEATLEEVRPLFETIERSIASDVAGAQRLPFVAQLLRQTGRFLLTDPNGLPGFLEAQQRVLKREVVGKGKSLEPGMVAVALNSVRRAVTPEGFEEGVL